MIVIVDYSVGNIASLLNILDHIGVGAEASSDPERIRTAERLILPGVGAFDKAMRSLSDRELIEPLREAVLERRAALLGVCLGMQLLGRRSEEGQLSGLGFIAADVARIPPRPGIKVPHVGWAKVESSGQSPLFLDRVAEERFYFVHSYHMVCDDPQDVAATVEYGERLCVAISRGNVHGVQFHPEKSHRFGMRLLKTFSEIK